MATWMTDKRDLTATAAYAACSHAAHWECGDTACKHWYGRYHRLPTDEELALFGPDVRVVCGRCGARFIDEAAS